MRTYQWLNPDWSFTDMDGNTCKTDIPHTWNALDGQDGGNDYRRGTCRYSKVFPKPDFSPDTQSVYLEFDGVNASARVLLNGKEVAVHHGGYSTFRCDVTEHLQAENTLLVEVDNSVNDRVYPQKADFTFYGGIYRDVKLLVVSKIDAAGCFDFDREKVVEYAKMRNPEIEVLFVSAKTGEGIPQLAEWITAQVEAWTR